MITVRKEQFADLCDGMCVEGRYLMICRDWIVFIEDKNDSVSVYSGAEMIGISRHVTNHIM
jgi:hypothetical protein